MIDVLVVDDHVIMRKGLQQLFDAMGDITMSGEAATGEEALALLCQTPYDLMLLDLTLPGLSGAPLIARIRKLAPELPILVYSMHEELPIIKPVFHAGVNGYVAKGSGQDSLVTAIRKVAAGGRFVDPSIAEELVFGGLNPPLVNLVARLSERENQVLRLLAQGLSINDIATALAISCKTVSTHKLRLMKKLNFKNNAALMRYAIEHHLED